MTASSCRRRRYLTKLDAQLALAEIDRRARSKRGSRREETRVVQCSVCRGWHLARGPIVNKES